ncbi:hypothetical protein ACX9R5_08150 [Rathayibacter sp. CAU 1779]
MTAALGIQIATTFTWLGLVVGISFIEAPVKFRTPGVTVELGVGIGRLVFHVLNAVEGIAAAVLLLTVFLQGGTHGAWPEALTVALAVVLAAGALVLRPLMDRRVRAGETADRMPRNNLHFGYVGLEVLKVVLLVWLGVVGLLSA